MYLLTSFLCLLHLIYAAPLERIMVDLTHVYDENVPNFPMWKKFEMEVVINGTLEGNWIQGEEIATATHMGTHMDAPSHFIPGGINIDQMPLSSFIAPAAVINIKAKAVEDHQAVAEVADLLQWEETTGQSLNGKLVLVNSGWDKKWLNRDEFLGTATEDFRNIRHPGIAGEAADFLVKNRDIIGVGTDTMSFDRGGSINFPAHNIVLGKGLFGLENVANLDKIPIYGAMVHVMPMNIAHASGAPTRVIATYPKLIFDQ